MKEPTGQPTPRMQPQQPTQVPVRQRVKAQKSPLKRILSSVVYIAWVGAFGYAGTWFGKDRSGVTQTIIKSLITNAKAEEEFGQNSINILLLGCDEDLAPGGKKVLKAAGRADMILIAHLDFVRKTITGVSVPRDTRTQLPGEPAHKLNAYHNLARPEEANDKQRQAVEFLTGVKIDRTIVLDYMAFQEMVDMVGGVAVTIKDKMDYDDNAGGLHVHFKPGKKLLSGYDAMCYVRFRKDRGGDYKRTERQRQLLMAFKGQVIKNWTNLPEIVDKGVEVLGKDTFTPKEVGALAVFSRGVQQKDIKMLRLPTHTGHGSFEELEEAAAAKMLTDNGFIPTKGATNAQ